MTIEPRHSALQALLVLFVVFGMLALIFVPALMGIRDGFWPVSIAVLTSLTYFLAKGFPWQHLRTSVWVPSFFMALGVMGFRYATARRLSSDLANVVIVVGSVIPFAAFMLWHVRQRRQLSKGGRGGAESEKEHWV